MIAELRYYATWTHSILLSFIYEKEIQRFHHIEFTENLLVFHFPKNTEFNVCISFYQVSILSPEQAVLSLRSFALFWLLSLTVRWKNMVPYPTQEDYKNDLQLAKI